jgi:hypothetical protein
MIYFAQSPAGGPIKIGQSIQLSVRLAQLICEHGPLIVLAVLDGDHPEEHALHQRFAPFRLNGEWFLPDVALLDYIGQHGRSWDGTNDAEMAERIRLIVDTDEVIRRAVRLRALKLGDDFTISDVVNDILRNALADEIAEVKNYPQAGSGSARKPGPKPKKRGGE